MQAEVSKTLMITGANRGLGLALTRLLLAKSVPYTLVLAVRDVSGFQPKLQQLQDQYPSAKFLVQTLDISSPESISKFAQWFRDNVKTLDILVNNAGLGDRKDYFTTEVTTVEIAKWTLATNFYGTVNITRALIPYLSSEGRVINVSSSMGTLDRHSEKIRSKLLDPSLTTEMLFSVAKDYESQIEARVLDGWAFSAYTVSKSLLNAFTRLALPKELSKGQWAVAVHPGWCRTDMGGSAADLSDEEGADRIYAGIFAVKDEKENFKFFIDYKVYDD